MRHSLLVFAFLTIHGQENRGKRRITREETQLSTNLSLKCGFRYSQMVIFQAIQKLKCQSEDPNSKSFQVNKLSENVLITQGLLL